MRGWLDEIRGLCAGLLLFVPLVDLLNPWNWLNSQIHKEKRWRETYAQPLAPNQVGFQWLGTTGFKIQKGDFVVLIDPYLTRVGLWDFLTQPLRSDTKILEEKIPKADYIFISDSHFDHFLDTPAIALRTGAKVVGSPNTAKLLRLFHIPESQIIETQGGETLQAWPFTVKVAKAVHGEIYWTKPFYGDVNLSIKPPLRVGDYVNLENRCYHFTVDGLRFFATSGSDLDEKLLQDFQCDILMVNVTALREGYIRKILRLTQPKVAFPTHYDNFFSPFSEGVQPWPTVDLKVFCDEVRESRPATKVVTFDFFQEYRADTNEQGT